MGAGSVSAASAAFLTLGCGLWNRSPHLRFAHSQRAFHVRECRRPLVIMMLCMLSIALAESCITELGTQTAHRAD